MRLLRSKLEEIWANLPHMCSPPLPAACLRNSSAHPLWHVADRRRDADAAVAPPYPRSVSRHRAAAVPEPCCDRQRVRCAPSAACPAAVAESPPQRRQQCCMCSDSVCHRPALSRLQHQQSPWAAPHVMLVDFQRQSRHMLWWPMSWCCESLWQLLPVQDEA